jgi:hypothetical protein
MIDLLVSLLVVCIVFGLIYWVIEQLPLPAPFGNIARVIVVVIGCIILLTFLLDIGHLRIRL